MRDILSWALTLTAGALGVAVSLAFVLSLPVIALSLLGLLILRLTHHH